MCHASMTSGWEQNGGTSVWHAIIHSYLLNGLGDLGYFGATWGPVLICAVLGLSSTAQSPITWAPTRILGAVYPQEAKFARIEGVVRQNALCERTEQSRM